MKGTFNFKKMFYFNDLNDRTLSKISLLLLLKSDCIPLVKGPDAVFNSIDIIKG